MVILLALVETGVVFAAVCASRLLWSAESLLGWRDGTLIVAQAVPVAACCMIAFYYNDLYDLRVVDTLGEFASRLLQTFGVAFMLLAVLYSVLEGTRIPAGPFLASLVVIMAILLPIRATAYVLMGSRPFVERVLILGTSPLAQNLIREIAARPHCRYVVGGVVSDGTRRIELPASVPLRAPLEALDTIIAELQPHRILVALTERRGQLPFRQLLETRVKGIPVEDAAELYERLTGKLAIESLTPSYLIFSKDFKKARLELAVSRAISLGLASVALVALAPVLAVVMIAIKLDSRGPIFVVQDRIGMSGRPFKLVKLRTMHPETGESSIWFRDNYTRITRVGKWLRKFRLDEIPQCLSILRGDMNLVGPRPHRTPKFTSLATQIPYFSLRSMVPPGLTGWAQVRHGYASSLDEEIEKVRYDLYYIKHLSFGLDLQILFDTVKIIVFGRGSGVAAPERPAVEAVADSAPRAAVRPSHHANTA